MKSTGGAKDGPWLVMDETLPLYPELGCEL